MWKDFFYFSRSERQGIIILVVLIIAVCTYTWFMPARDTGEIKDDPEFEKEYEAFITSVHEIKSTEKASRMKPAYQKRKVLLAPFDPNTADSITFLDLGLPPWMAGNILRYRAKGGQFRKPEDFRKIYGLTEDQYNALSPYISIPKNARIKDTIRLLVHKEPHDTLQFFKYPAGTVINLNQADTTELKKIPGIGSAIAGIIVGYRKRLGGFYKIEQLEDIKLSVDKLQPWFTVKDNETRRLNLNKAGIERLKAHPYINFYQAKVIVEYRRKKGKIQSLKQLELYEEFTQNDLDRIAHYICFE